MLDLRLIRTHSLSFTQTYSDSLYPIQIHSVSLRFIQSHSERSLTQICSVLLRFMRSHTDLLSLIQYQSDLIRFTKFTQSTQSHSGSLSFAQIHLDTFRSDQNSFRLTQPHTRLILPPSNSFRLSKVCSDLRRFAQTEQS